MQTHLDQLIAPNAEPRLLGGGFGFTEGPAANADGDVYLTDIGRRRIHFWDVHAQALTTVRENSGGADGMFVDANGVLWICEMHARRLSTLEKSGAYAVVLDSFQGHPFTGPNDLWFDACGGLYFTDSYAGHELRGNQTRLYYYAPSGKLSLLADDYYKSNGLHGSPDERWLYVADYLDDKVYRYAILGPGVLGERALFCPVRCDGMTVDQDGNVYLCTGNYGQGIVVVGPEGKTLGSITIPENAHNVCFGGPKFGTLYVTATHGFYSLRMNVKGALNGSPHGRAQTNNL